MNEVQADMPSEESKVKVTIFDNGPIEVIGPFTLSDENGHAIEFEPAPGEPVYFCRCGQSSDKPFCDGTHDDCGFASKLTK
jgi:CDGSH iron-sulfur domain-containing protein 3